MTKTPISRSFAMLSGSSAVTIVGGVVSAKSFAVLIGASGLGLMNVLQSVVTLAVIIAGMGVGAGVVQAGASALARGDDAAVAAMERSAWVMLAGFGFASFIAMIVFREAISRAIVGDHSQTANIVLLGIALVLTLGWTLDTSILNAHHRVASLAKIAVFKGSVGSLLAIAVIWIWRERGIAPAIVATAAANWIASRYFLRHIDCARVVAKSADVVASARLLLRFGIPFTASTLAGTGVQYLLPILVLHRLGLESAGFYGASAMIAVGYVSFFLNILAQDYYPRVSAERDDPLALTALINEQHRVLMMAGMPVVLGLIALARFIVPLVYASSFAPAAEVLEWQLIGDLLRFSAWTMSFVVLARNGSVVFLLTELAGGLTLLAASWWGIAWFGLPGIGIAFLLAAVVHNLVVAQVVRRDIGLVWSRENRNMILIGLAAALGIRLLGLAGLPVLRTVVALISVGLAGLNSIRLARAEMLRPRDVGVP